MGRDARRELTRDHAPRILRTGSEREPRPSRADETQLTAVVRKQEREEREAAVAAVLGHLDTAERELWAARESLPAVDRLTGRDLSEIRKRIRHIRERHE
jgi:hypothetical protein